MRTDFHTSYVWLWCVDSCPIVWLCYVVHCVVVRKVVCSLKNFSCLTRETWFLLREYIKKNRPELSRFISINAVLTFQILYFIIWVSIISQLSCQEVVRRTSDEQCMLKHVSVLWRLRVVIIKINWKWMAINTIETMT